MVKYLIIRQLVNDLCIFKNFVMFRFHLLPALNLIELKIMMVILFEIFSIRLLHSNTENTTKELPFMKIQ